MKNILFYKYAKISDKDTFREELFGLAKSLELLGTILVADEGINGCLTGDETDIDDFKIGLRSNKLFSDIEFKEGITSGHNFRRLSVRLREEIVTSKFGVDAYDAAQYIEPMELKKILDDGGDVVLLDARNDYEHKIGKFRNALTLPIGNFRELPEKIAQLKELKDKKVITYCTGGVRCEKASALLKENGFSEVYQLHGGILNYGKEIGNAHWEGKCFVFDTRGAVDIDPKNQSELISQCDICKIPCADYHNCLNSECDKRFIACNDCVESMEKCCSKRCRNEVRKLVFA